jgi:hypothetical protein
VTRADERDFNDLHVVSGVDAVKSCVDGASEPEAATDDDGRV